MQWMRPDDIYISKCSYRWWCSSCKRQVTYSHGNNARKLKFGMVECKYKYCPWCGEAVYKEDNNEEND